jgi:hypothetical protein
VGLKFQCSAWAGPHHTGLPQHLPDNLHLTAPGLVLRAASPSATNEALVVVVVVAVAAAFAASVLFCFLQGIASAPLWDGGLGVVLGVISASDFIHTLRRLRSAVSSGNNPLSEAEMDAHTVRQGRRGNNMTAGRSVMAAALPASQLCCPHVPFLLAGSSDQLPYCCFMFVIHCCCCCCCC